jgi:hypothetical protein
MPSGPSITVKCRSIVQLLGTAGGAIAFCTSIGGTIVGLSDFANAAAIFGRFTITHAKLVLLPVNPGGALPASGYMTPLVIGYFNDQTAASNPTTFN